MFKISYCQIVYSLSLCMENTFKTFYIVYIIFPFDTLHIVTFLTIKICKIYNIESKSSQYNQSYPMLTQEPYFHTLIILKYHRINNSLWKLNKRGTFINTV